MGHHHRKITKPAFLSFLVCPMEYLQREGFRKKNFRQDDENQRHTKTFNGD